MNIYRKFTIVFIICLFFYIIFRLVSHRIILLQLEGFNYDGFTESFTERFTPENSQVLTIKKENIIPQNITNINKNILSKPLIKTYIKSSYGGGYDGTDISLDMMNYTLSLGYRYVVIHVFYDIVNDGTESTSKTAVVGFSSVYSPLSNTANKTISLYDLLQNIQQNAFSPTSPNSGDPFFLHILPAYQLVDKENETNQSIYQSITGFNTQLNSQIEQALQDIKLSNRFSNNLKDSTPLDKINGKFVIVMDSKSINGNMTDNLKDLIGLSVLTSKIQSVKQLKQPTEDTFNIVLPINEKGALLTNNSDYINKYRGYKLNATPVCIWESRFIISMLGSSSGKTNLGEYEELFAQEGCAFII